MKEIKLDLLMVEKMEHLLVAEKEINLGLLMVAEKEIN